MCENTENINYNDFKNICRTCLFNCDLKPIQDNVIIIEILSKIIGVDFETNDGLPQQICVNCFEKFDEIRAFSLRCIETYSILTKQINAVELKQELIYEELELETIALQHEIIDETNNEYINPENIIQNPQNNTENEVISDKQITCDVCCKKFTRLSSLKRHKLTHSGERSFKCNICQKSFNEASILKIHRRTHHSGERPYKCKFTCDVCHKTFAHISSLQRHKLTHSGERSYKCYICQKVFKEATTLKIHRETEHSVERPLLNIGEYRFKCNVCLKTYKFKRTLKVHMLKHSGELRYRCDICVKAFYDPNGLRSHKAMHRTERPFQCNVCEKAFKYPSNLLEHKKMHSGERHHHTCNICSKIFMASSSLKRHKKIHAKLINQPL